MTMDPLALDKRRDNFLARQDDLLGQVNDGSRFWLTEVAADARYVQSVVSDANVSSPPTAAELTTIFGDPDSLSEHFCGLIDDNGAGTTVWLIRVRNSTFWYEQLTAAT